MNSSENNDDFGISIEDVKNNANHIIVPHPVNYNFNFSYVNMIDIYYSQSSVFIKNWDKIYHDTNSSICNTTKTPLKIVFQNNDIYIIGFFGINWPTDENIYDINTLYPILEVYDYCEDNSIPCIIPYVSINN